MEKLFVYKCENITTKDGLVTDFVYAYNLTKDKYMYLLSSDLKEYDVTYLDWLVRDFYYIYGPIMLEFTVKKNYVGEELFREVAMHFDGLSKESYPLIKKELGFPLIEEELIIQYEVDHEYILDVIDKIKNEAILKHTKN